MRRRFSLTSAEFFTGVLFRVFLGVFLELLVVFAGTGVFFGDAEYTIVRYIIKFDINNFCFSTIVPYGPCAALVSSDQSTFVVKKKKKMMMSTITYLVDYAFVVIIPLDSEHLTTLLMYELWLLSKEKKAIVHKSLQLKG